LLCQIVPMSGVYDIDRLSDDPRELQDIIRRIFTDNGNLTVQINKLKQENGWLREVIAARNRRLFGRKSEKLNYEELQAWLFNEAEMNAERQKAGDEENETVTVTYKRRRKRGRRAIPDSVPRTIIEHDLPDSEKICGCCHRERPRLKPEISEELDYIPARVAVWRHVYFKYGPCTCAGNGNGDTKPIISAPREKRIIPGSIAGSSLLAFLAASKFCDGLPFYRLEKMFRRYGIEYKRQTMCNQMIGLSRSLQVLTDMMWKELLGCSVIRMDETRLQVLCEPGREAGQISWMHVAAGEKEGQKIILFHYHTSRSGEVPKNILGDWQGYLQTDGLAAYNKASHARPGIKQVGCWSHVRRKFIDARGGPKAPPGGLADEALNRIKKLFVIEKELREKVPDDDEFTKQRRERVEPLLKELKDWADEYISHVPPKTLLFEAVRYMLNEWDKLKRYLEDPRLRPDNNIVENIIRYFVIGRKNWLFSNTPLGAHASAALYSIIQSAIANGLEAYAYLNYLFKVFPDTPEEGLP
jgi:transposase